MEREEERKEGWRNVGARKGGTEGRGKIIYREKGRGGRGGRGGREGRNV